MLDGPGREQAIDVAERIGLDVGHQGAVIDLLYRADGLGGMRVDHIAGQSQGGGHGNGRGQNDFFQR
ncbi:hypothetical protein D3C85_1566780 [compost metagenome]